MQHETKAFKPYPPSFLDRFMGWVKGFPIPYWLTYFICLCVEVSLFHIAAWSVGWQKPFTFNALLFVFPLWMWVPLAIMTHVDSISLSALNTFNQLLNIEEDELERLRYEFTTMPQQGAILSSVFWGINYLILTYLGYQVFYVAYHLGIFLTAVTFSVGLIAYLTGSAIYYYSIRQIILINRTVKMVKNFNLFRLDPVYAFSRVTSLIGASWMLIVQILLAIAAFVLPLWFVHWRLVAEKRKLIADLDRQIETVSTRLRDSLDANELEEMDHFSNAIMALNTEHEILNRIPTWPWRAGTLTGFLSAIVLPIVLFLIQLVIQEWLGM